MFKLKRLISVGTSTNLVDANAPKSEKCYFLKDIIINKQYLAIKNNNKFLECFILRRTGKVLYTYPTAGQRFPP